MQLLLQDFDQKRKIIPFYCCLQVQDVLLALARLYSSQLVQWAQEAAALIPSNVVTEGERISFLQAIQSAASGTDSDSLTNSMEEMSEVCRRNKKVMEAVQSALQPFNLSLTSVS